MTERTSWHPEDIKAAVRKRGTTLSRLALANNGHESLCRAALRRSSPVGEQIISTFLNVPLQELWPDRYSADGRRLATRHVRDEGSQQAVETHRLIGGAR